jgi:hypothetical protein
MKAFVLICFTCVLSLSAALDDAPGDEKRDPIPVPQFGPRGPSYTPVRFQNTGFDANTFRQEFHDAMHGDNFEQWLRTIRTSENAEAKISWLQITLPNIRFNGENELRQLMLVSQMYPSAAPSRAIDRLPQRRTSRVQRVP